MNNHSISKTNLITLSAVFTALTAVCSWISFTVPGTSVPINLATFAVLLTGVMLGHKYGALSMTVFLLLGAMGVPVFHSFTGGLGILAGPTGGFLIGYIFLAMAGGFYREGRVPFIAAAFIGETILYLCGCAWFTISTGSGWGAALTACVLPFIPGDIVKVIAVWFVSHRLSKIIPRS